MEARHSLSSLRGQGYAFFRPGARNSRHHAKDVGAAVEKHGDRRHCASHRISPSSTEGGIPIDEMGTVSLSSAGCNPEMGRSTAEKLRGYDDRSRVTDNPETDHYRAGKWLSPWMRLRLYAIRAGRSTTRLMAATIMPESSCRVATSRWSNA